MQQLLFVENVHNDALRFHNFHSTRFLILPYSFEINNGSKQITFVLQSGKQYDKISALNKNSFY